MTLAAAFPESEEDFLALGPVERAQRYRALAVQALERALRATYDDRARYLKLAAEWQRLAQEAEQ